MIRAFRLALYFVMGLLFGGLFSLAQAETMNATQNNVPAKWIHHGGGTGVVASGWTSYAELPTTYPDFCSRFMSAIGQAWNPSHAYTMGSCWRTSGSYDSYNVNAGCPDGGTLNQNGVDSTCRVWQCPAGQNWTLNGTTCSRPDCPAGEVRNEATGMCEGPCPAGQSRVNGVCLPDCEPSQVRPVGSNECVCDPAHLASFPSAYGGGMEGTGPTPDTSACVGGCMRNTGDFCLGGGGSWSCTGGAWTTQKCSGGATDKPPPTNKKPPCDATEGVMTSSSGKVSCVPEGKLDARKPVKNTTTTRTVAPDGTVTETTKTTTTDPATGATNTETTTKTTSPTGEVTNGSTETDSGGSGSTAKGEGDNSGDEPGDCKKEPDSPTCKKGTVKEKGEFGDGQNAELDAVKGELRAKFAEIKSAAMAMFNNSSSIGGGSLPCYAPVSVLGHNFSLCFTQYADKLSAIGGYVIFAATLLAVFIVLRR